MSTHQTIHNHNTPIRMWNTAIGEFEDAAVQQLMNTAALSCVHGVSAMPDCHWGWGAPIGSVILTERAIIPAAVGVDIGCGMCAVQTTLRADDLPDGLADMRHGLERRIPMGFAYNRKVQDDAAGEWQRDDNDLYLRLQQIHEKHPKICDVNKRDAIERQLGSLGGGNHFIEVCLDEGGAVWVMLHSGSRGIGNRIGTYFTERAREEITKRVLPVPDKDLAYLPEDSPCYDDYIFAMRWAQDFAAANRRVMLARALEQLKRSVRPFALAQQAINCHHNYAAMEQYGGREVWITRKGAVRARDGDLGIIPSAMGQPSYIVRGKGCAASYHSCSHGAGRAMSRNKARKNISLAQHLADTEGVECIKNKSVLDESPSAYKNIDKVMASQTDLVDVVATIKAVLCCKGV